MLLFAGYQTFQACPAPSCQVLLGLHIFRGRRPDVGPVERAEGVHGHLLGLRLVLRHHVRRHQPGGPVGGRGHGAHQVQGGHRLWNSLLRGDSPDNCLQHPLGPPVPVPEPRPHRSPPPRPRREPRGGQVSVRRSAQSGREQAQDVSPGTTISLSLLTV